MCGIFGFTWEDKHLLKKMNDVLLHRGPDDHAYYSDKVSLGMRRLAIIDLTKGIYPIKNEDEDLITVFNGELYNYQEIKDELLQKGHKFTTECDAEIIPHAYEEYGLSFLSRINGMFAIAMYDERKKKLILMRDKLGEKPVYYYHDKKNRRLAFASEIKCLLEIDEYRKEINEDALNDYFTYRYTPGDNTLFKGIKRLMPGHYLEFGEELKIKKFWDLEFSENDYSLEDNARIVREYLEDSVKIRLMSDVPLGAYLSGGLDSSAIVAIMAKHSDKVKTFNVSFGNTDFDESRYARLVADKFATDHTEINVDIDAIKVLPDVLWHLDEPIADAATIPTYIMSKETKNKVTVVLSGEGSDEIFGGYERFRHLNAAYKFRHIPEFIRSIPKRIYTRKDKTGYRALNVLSKLHDQENTFLSYYSVFDEEEKNDLYKQHKNFQEYGIKKYFKGNFFDALQKIDIKERLPNNMLLKGDKMMMAASLEGRVPFLDPRLVEFSATIPFNQKVSFFQDKIVYRKAIVGLVPDEIIKRKKHGFTIPTEKWAKEGLTTHLFDLVGQNDEPYLKKEYIGYIAKNIGKSFYYKRQYWAVLMYEQWYNKFMLG